MPHIIIEYSDNIGAEADVEQLVGLVHAAALASPIVPLAGLRTRAVPRRHYRVADGDRRNAFVAVVARLGPGRDAEVKHRFLERLLVAVEDAVSAVAPELDVSYSVEYQEIDAEFRINRNHIRARIEQENQDEDPTGAQPAGEESTDGS